MTRDCCEVAINTWVVDVMLCNILAVSTLLGQAHVHSSISRENNGRSTRAVKR